MRLGTESDNYMLSLLPTLLSELLFSVELKNKRLCVFKRRARKKHLWSSTNIFLKSGHFIISGNWYLSFLARILCSFTAQRNLIN